MTMNGFESSRSQLQSQQTELLLGDAIGIALAAAQILNYDSTHDRRVEGFISDKLRERSAAREGGARRGSAG